MEVAQLILGNSNKRFSGVTSTMLQTLPEVRKLMPLAVMGRHHLPSSTSTIRFWDLVLLRDRTRIFHARRNNEMIQALAARKLGAKIKIIFTSTAQRHHTRFTRWLCEGGTIEQGSQRNPRQDITRCGQARRWLPKYA